jgi:pyruvate/2-oxoglutarate dehydrogenase complex dihydrolipoamide dehydrogenase (E3) component
MVPAAHARRVLVVGGGPAGMAAARTARERGHDVSLWDRDAMLGGKLDVASRAPSKGEVLRFREHEVAVLEALGVDVRLGIEVDAAAIAREDPDVVVVATGADALLPPIAGADGPGVVDAQALLHDCVPLAPGAHVAIVGGSATGCETAELLLDRGVAVTILEMTGSIGHGIEAITRRWLVRELRRRGATVLTRATVAAIDAGLVRYETADGPGEVAADVVALAVGWRPRGAALADAIAGREVVVVGDAEQPADFVAATSAGAAAALRL